VIGGIFALTTAALHAIPCLTGVQRKEEEDFQLVSNTGILLIFFGYTSFILMIQ
jgi:hypothetical protein